MTGGSQQITLNGSGTPIEDGTNEFSLTTNSSLGSASCSFNIKTAVRKMKIIGLSDNNNAYDIAASGNLLNKVLLNENYFSNNQESVVPVNGFEFLSLSSLNQTQFNNFSPDIVFVQYNYTATSTTDQQFLADYVANGGVLIYCTDGNGPTAPRNVAAKELARLILDNDSMEVTGADTNNLMTIKDSETIITSGPFLDLVGKSMGRDAGNNFRFEIVGFPFEKASVIAYGDDTDSSIRAFVSKTKGFAFFGDGAPFAANEGTQPYNYPAKFKTTNNVTVAIPNPYGAVTSYNSFLFLNLMAWAIDYVQNNNP